MAGQDMPAFDSLVAQLEAAPHFVLDTETTTIYWREAEIVGLSFAVQAHEARPRAHVLRDGLLRVVRDNGVRRGARGGLGWVPQSDHARETVVVAVVEACGVRRDESRWPTTAA